MKACYECRTAVPAIALGFESRSDASAQALEEQRERDEQAAPQTAHEPTL